jgi:hypothetical protein
VDKHASCLVFFIYFFAFRIGDSCPKGLPIEKLMIMTRIPGSIPSNVLSPMLNTVAHTDGRFSAKLCIGKSFSALQFIRCCHEAQLTASKFFFVLHIIMGKSFGISAAFGWALPNSPHFISGDAFSVYEQTNYYCPDARKNRPK